MSKKYLTSLKKTFKNIFRFLTTPINFRWSWIGEQIIVTPLILLIIITGYIFVILKFVHISNFELSINKNKFVVPQGSTFQTSITVRSINNYKKSISFSADGQPSDVIIDFSSSLGENKPTFNCIMKIIVGLDVQPNDYPILIKGIGKDGVENKINIILSVKEKSVNSYRKIENDSTTLKTDKIDQLN